MKKLLILLSAGVIFSACTQANPTPKQNNTRVPAAEQKIGDTSKTGTISQSGATFFINVIGQEPEVIESYAVELADYVGQTVTVIGQYSGDTLFVGKIE